MRKCICCAIAVILTCSTTTFAQCVKEPLVVFISRDFNKNRVELVVDNKVVFNQIIQVNESVGVEEFDLVRTTCKQKISLKVNGVLLHTMWLDHKGAFMKGIGYSKTGITVGTEFFVDKLPLID